MQDTETQSPKSQIQEMSPYMSSKYESPLSSRSNSPVAMENGELQVEDASKFVSDDEISVGCPSPALHSPKYASGTPEKMFKSDSNCRCSESDSEDYFKPLKRLKMVNIETDRRTSPTLEVEDRPDGVKSFSIVDILNHRPAKNQNTRIVRPWDLEPDMETQQNLERFHRHLKAQQLALLRPDFSAFSTSYTSETGSDRSSSVASDCCSPDIVPTTVAQHRQRQTQGKQPGATPLDALFQMTSKTFDSTNGETNPGRIFLEY